MGFPSARTNARAGTAAQEERYEDAGDEDPGYVACGKRLRVFVAVDDRQRGRDGPVDASQEGGIRELSWERRGFGPGEIARRIEWGEGIRVVVARECECKGGGAVPLDYVFERHCLQWRGSVERLDGEVLDAAAVCRHRVSIDQNAEEGRDGVLVADHPVRLVHPIYLGRVPGRHGRVGDELDERQLSTGSLRTHGVVRAILLGMPMADPIHGPKSKGERLSTDAGLSDVPDGVRVSTPERTRPDDLLSCPAADLPALEEAASRQHKRLAATRAEIVRDPGLGRGGSGRVGDRGAPGVATPTAACPRARGCSTYAARAAFTPSTSTTTSATTATTFSSSAFWKPREKGG